MSEPSCVACHPIAKEILSLLASKGLTVAEAHEVLSDVRCEIRDIRDRIIEKKENLLSSYLSL